MSQNEITSSNASLDTEVGQIDEPTLNFAGRYSFFCHSSSNNVRATLNSEPKPTPVSYVSEPAICCFVVLKP